MMWQFHNDLFQKAELLSEIRAEEEAGRREREVRERRKEELSRLQEAERRKQEAEEEERKRKEQEELHRKWVHHFHQLSCEPIFTLLYNCHKGHLTWVFAYSH